MSGRRTQKPTFIDYRPVEFFGKEASAFTKPLLEGKRVRLEYDQERTDRYGRPGFDTARLTRESQGPDRRDPRANALACLHELA